MSLLDRFRKLGDVAKQVGQVAVEVAQQQPEIKRRLDRVRARYTETRQVIEQKVDEIEADLWDWIREMQDQAQHAHRQVQRVRDANDYYRTLGLPAGAGLNEVKSAWRKKMHENHPDKFAHDPQAEAEAHRRAQEINLAYQELTALLTGREHRRAN
ncbi:MAG: J domain-containing protein [Myxococcota bacterium]|nr:J domain-containing protein [Myxococcota bacterium]